MNDVPARAADNPYTPPGADVRDAESAPPARRPALIWLTQLLVGASGAYFLMMLFLGLGRVPQRLALAGLNGLWFFTLVITAALASFLVWLFIALWQRHRAAHFGGIAFATMLLLLAFPLLAEVRRTAPYVLPGLGDTGAIVLQVVVPALLVLYPWRMYASRTVRAFYGISK